ncbi:hypothetical protein [Streptomyces scopuliridis]|uniref:hypothetical protein n=1 Tax=Streptomyces scopuliridis TaxID=452529 RepID=UPI003691A1C3
MLTRGPAVDDELVFFAMPYGKRTLPNGEDADFDVLYERYFAEAVRSMELTPERADCMPGTMESPLSAAWNGVDRAGVVVIDLSLPSTSVSMELGWAMALHKRAIVIHHEGAALPTNIVGQVRAIKYRCDMTGLPDMQAALRLAIEEARRQSTPEMDLRPRTGVRDVEAIAEVVWTAADHIYVRDIQNELRTGVMRRTDMDYLEALPDDMTKRFREHGRVRGVFVTDENGTRFSQRHGKTNPWPSFEMAYLRGALVRAKVVQINRGGCFVELEEGGKSRLSMAAAEAAGLDRGSEVRVRVLSVDPVRQRIEVTLADRTPTVGGVSRMALTPDAERQSAVALPRSGEQYQGTVTSSVCERGFALVALDGWSEMGQSAILHVSRMTAQLRKRFEAGAVAKGDRLRVEVLSAALSPRDPERGEVRLREVPANVWATAGGAPETETPDSDAGTSETGTSEGQAA